MKTIPVSLVLAGSVLGALAAPGPEEGAAPPPPPQMERPNKGGGPEGGRGGVRQTPGLLMKADTNKDGEVSKQEFTALERIANLPEEKQNKIFERLDKNSDGKLTKDELDKQPDSQPRGFPRLDELDKDGSGGVSFEEFKAAGFVAKLPPEKQEGLFKRLDTDGDGQLSPKDRPEGPMHRDGPKGDGPKGDGPRGGPRGEGDESMNPRHLLRTLDANGDGAVTFDEYQKASFAAKLGEDALEKRFEKLDRNGDKKISAEDAPPKPEGKPDGEPGRPEKPEPKE